jgi:hypothetical protein
VLALMVFAPLGVDYRRSCAGRQAAAHEAEHKEERERNDDAAEEEELLDDDGENDEAVDIKRIAEERRKMEGGGRMGLQRGESSAALPVGQREGRKVGF